MATQYAFGKIVTDGLVLCLDAADRNSYVSGSTTWFDVAGTNNGTLTNGPTFNTGSGGSIVFDGTNDYVITTPTILNTPWSLCTVFKPSSSQNFITGYPVIYSQNNLNIWVGITPNLAIGVHSNNGNRSDTPAGSITLNQIYFIGVSSSPSALFVYINNTKYSLTPQSNPSNATKSSIGSNIDYSPIKDFFMGNIFNFSIYNRALTDSEVLQNYSAQKSRFGL
jgi:hypothetical protein